MITNFPAVIGEEAHSRAIRELETLGIGKWLPDAVYVHRSIIDRAELAVSVYLACLDSSAGQGEPWTVAKLHKSTPQVSLLNYPGFDDEPFPVLTEWLLVSAEGTRLRQVRAPDGNRSVLHRKELLLPPGDGRSRAWAAVTKRAEELGLFDDPTSIGQMSGWERLLEERGVRVVGSELIVVGTDDAVHRHRTALVRYALSTPVRTLHEAGLLSVGTTFFDYGCGRGDDVRLLSDLGVDAIGWDPHFRPDVPRKHAGVVNLGFVLNVIENPEERVAALAAAWKLAERVLAVGVLVGGRSAWERHRLFLDGVITSRGTFQKYFSQEEICHYVGRITGREPIATAPGILLVFRDDDDEQAFLASRQVSRPPRLPIPARPPRIPRDRTPKRSSVDEVLVASVWEMAVGLGRCPEEEELDEVRGSNSRRAVVAAFKEAVRRYDPTALSAGRLSREADILVFLALRKFERRKSASKSVPSALRRDVRNFFGDVEKAETLATKLLFSAGIPGIIREAAIATSSKLGRCSLGPRFLDVRAADLVFTEPVIRVFVGCASQLYGIGGCDIVRVHLDWPMVSLMSYDDFDGRPFPALIDRIRIDLRRQVVRIEEIVGSQFLLRRSHFEAVGINRELMSRNEAELAQRAFVSNLWEHVVLPHGLL